MKIVKYNDTYFDLLKANVSDKRIFTYWTGWELPFPLQSNDLNAIIKNRNTEAIVFENENDFIGYTEIGSNSGIQGYFTRFLINQSKRNQGCGKIILQEICKILFNDRNKIEIVLTTYMANTSALKLYEDAGFETIEKTKIWMDGIFSNETWTKIEMKLNNPERVLR